MNLSKIPYLRDERELLLREVLLLLLLELLGRL